MLGYCSVVICDTRMCLLTMTLQQSSVLPQAHSSHGCGHVACMGFVRTCVWGMHHNLC
jgi:hypothetical protein